MYAQSVMLSLTAHGLASCPQTALAMESSLIRESLSVADSNKLLFGLSFGYEDTTNVANRCQIGRAAVEDVVRFVET